MSSVPEEYVPLSDTELEWDTRGAWRRLEFFARTGTLAHMSSDPPSSSHVEATQERVPFGQVILPAYSKQQAPVS